MVQNIYQDKLIMCCDCGQTFKFGGDEAAFYASKQLFEPKRCKPCREIRKQTLRTQEGVM